MTAHAAAPPSPEAAGQMGRQLVAAEHRQRLIQALQVAAVWATLIALLTVVLLQINIEPGYLLRRGDILRLIVVNGLGVTLGVSLAAVAAASVLALLGALGRLSSNPLAQGVAGFYVSVVRGTPLLIQLFLIYNGLAQIGTQLIHMGYPALGNALILKEIPAGILALSLNYGAYMTEIFRAGIQSIHHGQWEAAQALGLSPAQTLGRIILPQAIRIIIPDIGNQFIAMQKDSALISVIGVWEITYLANRSARLDSKYIEMFLTAAAVYWVLTLVSTFFQSRLEKRMATAYER